MSSASYNRGSASIRRDLDNAHAVRVLSELAAASAVERIINGGGVLHAARSRGAVTVGALSGAWGVVTWAPAPEDHPRRTAWGAALDFVNLVGASRAAAAVQKFVDSH